MTTLYGIKNCDTIKKARKWLDENQVAYTFHDYRKDGLSKKQLENWASELGWENLINKRGTTWRQLPDADKASLTKDKAVKLMLENVAIIKRPLLESGDQRLLGFKQDEYAKLFY